MKSGRLAALLRGILGCGCGSRLRVEWALFSDQVSARHDLPRRPHAVDSLIFGRACGRIENERAVLGWRYVAIMA